MNATMDWMPTVLARHQTIEQEPLPRNIDALLTERAIALNPGSVAWHFIATGAPSPMCSCVNRFRAVRADCGRSSVCGMQGCGDAAECAGVSAELAGVGRWRGDGAGECPLRGRELHYAVTDSEAEIVVLDAAFLPVLADARLELPASHVVVVGDVPAGFTPWHSLLSEAVDTDTASHVGIDDLMNIHTPRYARACRRAVCCRSATG